MAKKTYKQLVSEVFTTAEDLLEVVQSHLSTDSESRTFEDQAISDAVGDIRTALENASHRPRWSLDQLAEVHSGLFGEDDDTQG